MEPSPNQPTIHFRLHELCERLEVSHRDARCICERGWLPASVDPEPGRGNHRRLTPAQAVGLGIVLKLKVCGVQTPKAARIRWLFDAAFRTARLQSPCGWSLTSPRAC